MIIVKYQVTTEKVKAWRVAGQLRERELSSSRGAKDRGWQLLEAGSFKSLSSDLRSYINL